MAKASQQPLTVSFNIKNLLNRIGIIKAHHLFQQIGGSPSNAAALFEGNISGLKFDTVEKLLHLVLAADPSYFRAIVKALNASDMFVVTGPNIEVDHAKADKGQLENEKRQEQIKKALKGERTKLVRALKDLINSIESEDA